jgi:AAA+ superfamily predicted ATPase
MVFLGNPGTGKTTVARIIAEILYNLKYIQQDKLIEVSSKDLVGEYVGQTAPKTMSVIEKAMGGLLFIDEAYTLASTGGISGNSYNEEAIATLIQAMENYRDKLVVIFAGYTKEMQAFLNSNSGIVSRIGYTLEFDDYTTDELIQIFNGMMKKSGFTVSNEAVEKLRSVIEEYRDTENFGNARFVRNVYEKTIIKHASNTKNKTSKKVLKTISAEDISTDELLKM